MNVYLFEIKLQLRGFIIWTVSILFFFILFMTGLYPSFRNSLNDVLKIYAGFPPQFSAAFGIDIASMFSFSGFYCFVYLYLAIVGAIMAVSISVATFAREKRSKCTDFLLTKPLNRGDIFLTKAAANITLLVAMNFLFIAASIISFKAAQQNPTGLSKLIAASFSMLLMQLVFWALGVFFAISAKKVRSVSGIATSFGFGAFIVSALYGILKENAIRFIAPLKYFDPIAVLSTGSYEVKYAITGVLVFFACVLAAYVRYCRGDVHAV